MVHGSFLVDRDLPTIQIPIAFRETVIFPTFILDTGFSGYVKFDQQTADELGIVAKGVTYVDNANGQRVLAQLSTGYAELENKKRPIDIIIADGPLLAGMGLFMLFEYKVVIDCKNRTAQLEQTRRPVSSTAIVNLILNAHVQNPGPSAPSNLTLSDIKM